METIKHIYGIRSISIGEPVEIETYEKFISSPIINRQGGIQFSKTILGSFSMEVSDLSPKIMRMFFGNNWNKHPQEVVCRFKLKNKAFARPIYQTFVFMRHSVDTKKKLKSITEFVKACYN